MALLFRIRWHLIYVIAVSVSGLKSINECIALTNSSRAMGHTSAVQPTVCEWLGVPYAVAPMGDLRFEPPIRLPLPETITANQYGFDCPQNQARLFAYPNATAQYAMIFSSFTNQLNHTQSEDCLTLNIWSKPSADRNKKPKPVMMWIHGGRFSTGSSHTAFYEGSKLAEAQDVVVVTFNFRMNIFGFPGSPETTQNLGFLDQHMAATWVWENIASFGGDPNRITILGQSSGAVAAGNWAFAFRENPIAAGLVSHSGNELSFPMNSLEMAAKNWYNVTESLGCDSTGGNTLVCMRSPNITFQAILNSVSHIPPLQTTPTRSQPPFQATIDNVTAFSEQEYIYRLQSGDLARIPYFEIIDDYESGFYKISALSQGNSLPESEWTRFQFESFTCPTAADARARSELGIPTYRARYMADWDNMRLYDRPSSDAYHGVDLNMIFGNSKAVSGIAPSPEEEELTRAMQRAWAAFAADPPDGLSAFGWPKYDAGEDSLIRLGVNTTSTVDFAAPVTYDGLCSGLHLGF